MKNEQKCQGKWKIATANQGQETDDQERARKMTRDGRREAENLENGADVQKLVKRIGYGVGREPTYECQ